jgi:uncharacterized protein involved in exopolysaccharide biosynthesis
MSTRAQLSSIPIPDPSALTTEAVKLAKEQLTEILDIRLAGHKELVEEKFKGVGTEFTMRDIALAAAFKAAEAAVKQQNESNTLAIDKSSDAFTKQIDTLDEKINDLKERVSELHSKNWSTVGAYIVGAVGIIALIVTALRPHIQ